jgi:hypothetical protein
MKIYISLFSIFLFSACASNPTPPLQSHLDTSTYRSIIDRAKKLFSSQEPADTFHLNTSTVAVAPHFSYMEMRIIDTLKRLPEIKKQQQLLDSITNHTDKVSFILNPPVVGNRNYIVQVGDMRGDQFEEYYLFYVQPDSFIIRVQDNNTNYLMSLDEWRKMLTQRD